MGDALRECQAIYETRKVLCMYIFYEYAISRMPLFD